MKTDPKSRPLEEPQEIKWLPPIGTHDPSAMVDLLKKRFIELRQKEQHNEPKEQD